MHTDGCVSLPHTNEHHPLVDLTTNVHSLVACAVCTCVCLWSWENKGGSLSYLVCGLRMRNGYRVADLDLSVDSGEAKKGTNDSLLAFWAAHVVVDDRQRDHRVNNSRRSRLEIQMKHVDRKT